MAFYNRKVVKNKLLRKAWRAAHLRKLDDAEKICLPEICDEIARWIRRDRRPRNRLSLRSFSVLLSGATRLYSQQINLLLKDTFDLILPAVDQTLRSDCSEEDSFELMPEMEVIPDCSEEDSFELMPEMEVIPPDTTPSTDQAESSQYPDDTESSFDGSNSTPNSNQQITGENSQETRDQQIQTSPIPEPMGNIGGFDPNLPFGYIMVHDKYHSRLPRMIIFSSLSEKLRTL